MSAPASPNLQVLTLCCSLAFRTSATKTFNSTWKALVTADFIPITLPTSEQSGPIHWAEGGELGTRTMRECGRDGTYLLMPFTEQMPGWAVLGGEAQPKSEQSPLVPLPQAGLEGWGAQAGCQKVPSIQPQLQGLLLPKEGTFHVPSAPSLAPPPLSEQYTVSTPETHVTSPRPARPSLWVTHTPDQRLSFMAREGFSERKQERGDWSPHL